MNIVGNQKQGLLYSSLSVVIGVLLIVFAYSDGLLPDDIGFIVFGLFGIVIGPLGYFFHYMDRKTAYKKNITTK